MENNNYNKSYKNFIIDDSLELKFKKEGFVNEKGYLREKLLTDEAEIIAKGLKQVSVTQMRAFFNEVKALKNRLESNNIQENFEKIYPLILIIKSKIQYKYAKDKKLKNLKEFLYAGIAKIQEENKKGKGKEAFENFAIFFETIVGYYYYVNANKNEK